MEKLDLQNLELIYESSRSRVYRGKQENNKPVVLKLMALDAPSVHELAQLKQEHDILAELDHKGIIKSYGISTIAQRTALTLEDFGGVSLTQILAKQPLPLEITLDIAIKVCDALAVLHQHNIIHKDINPSNIVWNKASTEVKIIDFNIATTLNRELVEFKSLNLLEGTLPYISPEQTGRMNRAVDYRSDLYSFGATLYHLFTGQLPFEAEGEIGFVHAHIAKEPLPPNKVNQKLPTALSEIVLKLLAKNAEDRYQSALGLKRDLERCFKEWQETKNINPFVIAENDVPNKFRLPQKLYGREVEVKKLLNSFERVNQTGQAEILLVTGYAGVGKTTLVQEVHKPITAGRGYFITGKFDQLQRDIPYRALVQAFESLTKQLLSESAKELAHWKEKLLEVLDTNAGVITEVIPSLESIIGKQPEVIKLPPEQTKNRFNLTFQNFIKVLAQPEHPLTIFLDDLQWADDASLQLLEQIYLRSNDKSLLLIGAYRDNEISPTHSLSSTLKQVEENGAIIHSVDLKPLKVEGLETMLVDALYTTKENIKSLAKLLEKKTQGNPYFVGEFLKELYLKEVLYFADGSWQWDIDLIEKWGFTDNIVELMVGKIEALATGTKYLLTRAACIGATFDLATLATVTQKTQAEILLNLQPALTQDLLLRRKEAYTFAHDRVQQAAYASISENAKQTVHLEIGKHLLAATPEAELAENIFSIVDQINAGLALITLQQEKDQLAELNLMAGKRAKVSAAYQPALAYLQTALQLLGNDSWARQYQLSLTIHEETAEAADISKNYEFVDSLFDAVNSNARTTLDKVTVYMTRMLVLTRQGKLQQAIKTGLDILKQLGLSLPAQPNRFHVMKAILKILQLLLSKRANKLIDLPTARNLKTIAIMNVCDSLHPIFGVGGVKDFNLWFIVIQKQIAIQLKYGNYSPLPYAVLAILLILKLNKIKTGHQFTKLAFDLNTQFSRNDEAYYATNHVVHGILTTSQAHIKQAISKLEQNYNSATQNGHLNAATVSLGLSLFYRFSIGENLSKLEHDLYLAKIASTQSDLQPFSQNEFLNNFHDMMLQVVSYLQYNPDTPSFLGNVPDKIRVKLLKSQSSNFLSVLVILKLMVTYTFGKYDQTIAFVKIFEEIINMFPATVPIVIGNFYSSLTRLALFEETRNRKLLSKVRKNQKKMKLWAKHAPMNYLHKWHLVEAERCRVLGKDNKAWHYYKAAIKGAQENNYVNEEALALELTAKFFLKKNDKGIAGYYIRESYGAYTRWGAVTKLKQLEENYPQLLIEPFSLHSNLSATTGINHYASTSTEHGNLDITSLMQASQTISSELRLDSLLDSLMKTLIENAAAQRGLLLLPKGGDNEAWIIKTHSEGGTLKEIALEEAGDYLPLSLIRFVIRSKEHVTLANANESEHYQQDPYVLFQRPKSVMALPLIHQGKLVGIVYLENNLAAEAFSEDRVEVLTLLSTQAAISLQNALLLSELQDKVTQLEVSRKRLVQIEENQRRDLAEHLHSRVQSILLANCLKLSDCINRMVNQEDKSLKADMQEVNKALEDLHEKDIRQLSHMLHPSIINICLVPAIESLLNDLPKDLKVQLEVDQAIAELDNPKDNKLTENFRLTVYRIIEEALLNIQKHAKASVVGVSLHQDKQDLVLEVTDDGCGFSHKTTTRGGGLFC